MWIGLRRFISGTHALALADQAVVSLASFLTTVVIARSTDSSELGAYAIGISLLASVLAIQDSLILLPYSIQRHRPLGTPAERAGSSLTLGGLLAVASIAVLTLVALGLWALGEPPELVAMSFALLGAVPFVLSREFARRFAFAHLQIAQALAIDVAVAVVQLAALGWLASTGRMSAVVACCALGAACGVSAAGWLYLARAQFAISLRQVPATLLQSWDLGKWLFVGQMTVQVQRYVTYWLSIVIAGAAVTGVYAACMSIVSFANPLIFGLGNILTPRSVLAWKSGGGAALRRQATHDALLLVAVMTAFCLAVLFAGDTLMHFLYRGNEFEGHGHTVTVLALAMAAFAVGTPASNALAGMERPRAIVAVGTIGAVLTVALVWWLMSAWGLLGAAYGVLTGNAIGAAGRWVAFLALVPRACDPTPLKRVLQEVTRTSDDAGWEIAHLGEGDHALVYAVQSTTPQPIWREYRSLVLKLYRPEAALDLEMVHAQLDALARLHTALDGRTANGWKISSPLPLYVCESPLALVMTMVPGRDLESCAAAGDSVTPETLSSAARAFVGAMQQSWSRGQLHGDLGLRNVLFDIEAKGLSFIDGGTLESCAACNDGAVCRSPAALDLAHLLTDLATDVTDMMGSPASRARTQIFAESALRTFMETIGPRDERRRFLGEVRECVHEHLVKTLDVSWSPRGLWHWFVKQVSVRRIRSMLDRLEAELDAPGTDLGADLNISSMGATDRDRDAEAARERRPDRMPVRG